MEWVIMDMKSKMWDSLTDHVQRSMGDFLQIIF